MARQASTGSAAASACDRLTRPWEQAGSECHRNGGQSHERAICRRVLVRLRMDGMIGPTKPLKLTPSRDPDVETATVRGQVAIVLPSPRAIPLASLAG